MSATPPPTITEAPSPAPQRGDRATFADRVDAFVTWLITAVTQFGAVATNVYNNAVVGFESAAAAVAAANAAQSTANAIRWVSGTTYALDVSVISPLNSQTYRRRVAGAGSTDPSLDSVNWASLARSSRFNPIALAALDMDLALGDSFTKTISTSSTFTFSNIPAGGSSWMLKLKLDGGSAAFPASVRPVNNGAVPSMSTGKTHRVFFMTEDGGASVAMVIAPNFAN